MHNHTTSMKTILLAALAVVAISMAPVYAAVSNEPNVIAVDSLGFSVVLPDSTLPSHEYMHRHEGVYEWHYREKTGRNPEPWIDSAGRRVVFYAEYNHTRTGALYFVIVRIHGPLFYSPSEEAELRWEAMAEIAFSKMRSDTLQSYRPVIVDGNPGGLFAYGGTEDRPNIVHGLTAIRGDMIYTLYAHLPNANDTTAAEEFLSSFRLKPGPVASTISTPKGAAYIRFIRTLTGKQRIGTMFACRHIRSFAKADLPAMYEALRTPFADEEMDEFFSMRRYLLDNIVRMDSTPDIAFLSELYSIDSLEDFRRSILEALVQIGTIESVSAAAQFMLTDPPKYSPTDWFYHHKGRPELARYMLPCVPARIEDRHWRNEVVEFLVGTLTKGHITTADLAPYSDTLARSTMRYLSSYTAWKQTGKVQKSRGLYRPEHGTPIRDVVLALFLCDQPGIVAVLQTFLQDSALGLYACASLLGCGEQVDSSLVYRFAADPGTRALLYGAMQQTRTTAHFPEEFRSQRSITESMITDWYADEHYTPQIEYLATRDHTDTVYNRFSGRFLYFKVLLPPSLAYTDYSDYETISDSTEYESDPEESTDEATDNTPRWYIMMCGLYSTDPLQIEFDKETIIQSIALPFEGSTDEELFAKMFRYFLLSHQPG